MVWTVNSVNTTTFILTLTRLWRVREGRSTQTGKKLQNDKSRAEILLCMHLKLDLPTTVELRTTTFP